MTFPSDNQDPECNVDAVESDNGRFSPVNEFAEYFIQFRHEDLIDTINSFYFDVDINEDPLIWKILHETKDSRKEFRNILRDGVTLGTILLNHDRDDRAEIDSKMKILRNKIKINLSVPQSVMVKELNASDYEGEIVTFEAKISNWGKIRTIAYFAEYKCIECDKVVTKPYNPKIKELRERCSCKGIYEFYKPVKSEDTRRITLREIIDDYSDGKLPFAISADVYGKTMWEIELSDRVMVTGIYRSVPLAKQDGKISKEFIPTIQVISTQNTQSDQIEFPDMALMKKFKDLEKEGKLIDAVINGFAYNIYKKKMEKKSVICSMIGSMWIGKKGNGNPPMIHVLFVGDPDTYKSTIMKYIINVSDNCVLADSTTVSNAGVKAIAVRMDDGQWSIMAGLIPTYSGGNVFFDEFGDLKPDIYADLKAPMIDGRVSKYMAGEEFNGEGETGILASMNPIEGVYDNSKTIYDNLERLPKPLITRFDIIFKFSKQSNDYNSVAIRKHFKKCDLLDGKPEDLLSDSEIKLFINYVKTIKPKLTEGAVERNNEFFARIEAKGGEKRGTETRTENAIIKFAVALAKWHMSTKVTAMHVDEAIKMYTASLETFNLHLEEGEDINDSSLKKTVDGRTQAIEKAFNALKDTSGYAFRSEVVDMCMDYGCFDSRAQCETVLERLLVLHLTTFLLIYPKPDQRYQLLYLLLLNVFSTMA